MARITLFQEGDDPALDPLVKKIRSGRRNTLNNLYRALLRSPPITEAWFQQLNAVRFGTRLDGRLRELVIIRIAWLNDVKYQLRQHIPSLAVADGVSVAECAALADWRPSAFFDARERAVLAYVDEMMRNFSVPDAVFAALKPHFSERQIVELTVLAATYSMHGHVLRALDIDLEKVVGDRGH
jgi:alkylhydroperoxidase family enzyme